MLLVLPVSTVDFPLAIKLASVFEKLGGLSEVEALVVTIPENAQLAEDYAQALRPSFAKVGVHLLEGACPTGWPRACNFYFTRTAQHLEFERKIQEPWYYFEADNVPLKEGWFAALLTEYNLAGKPFMGVLQDTYRINPETNEVSVHGGHMVGTGIYPPDLSKYSILYRVALDEPWDVLCQWEIAPNAHGTTLIQHNWGTVNYAVGKDGAVVCEDRAQNRGGITHNKPLDPKAVLLHGAKDGSLADLVLAGFKPAQKQVAAPAPKPAKAPEAPAAPSTPPVKSAAVSALAALSRATTEK